MGLTMGLTVAVAAVPIRALGWLAHWLAVEDYRPFLDWAVSEVPIRKKGRLRMHERANKLLMVLYVLLRMERVCVCVACIC
jgi:hypothetical protein